MADYIEKNYAPVWINVAKPSRDTLEGSNAATDIRQSTWNAEGGMVPVIYGIQNIGSKIIAATTSGGSLVLGILFCEGVIEQFSEIAINDTLVITAPAASGFSGGIAYRLYKGDQIIADPVLSSIYSDINYSDVLNPLCYAVLSIDVGVVPGFPRITALIKGKKVYDPRDANQILTDSNTWTWSNNPSLCLADLITSDIYGLSRLIDWTTVAECANCNDKLVLKTPLPPPVNMWPYLPIATFVERKLIFNKAWTRTDLVDYYLNLPNIHAKRAMVNLNGARTALSLYLYHWNGNPASAAVYGSIYWESDTLLDSKFRIQKDIWDTRDQWGDPTLHGVGPVNSNEYTTAEEWFAASASQHWTFITYYGWNYGTGSAGDINGVGFDNKTMAYRYLDLEGIFHDGFALNGRPINELEPPPTLETSRMLDIVIDAEQETTSWIETLRGYASCFVVADGNYFHLIPDKPIGYGFSAQASPLSFVKIPWNTKFDITGEMSLEISMLPDSSSVGVQTIVSKGSYDSNDFSLAYDKDNSNFLFSWYNTDGQIITYTIVVSPLSTSVFTTLSLSLDSLGNLTVYLFDESVILITSEHQVLNISRNIASFDFGIRTTVPGSNIFLAAAPNSPDNTHFGGILDEFRLWSTKRLLAEVSHNAKIPLLEGTDSRLVCHLKFNEGYSSRTKATGASEWVSNDITKDFATDGSYATLYASTTDVSVWTQHDSAYDFYKFDGSNTVDSSVKIHKRGIFNIPTVIELEYTNTLDFKVIDINGNFGNLRPWKQETIRLDNSSLHNNKARISRVPMPGVTRVSQAQREAQERYNSIVSDSNVVFTALDDALNVTVGDGIQFHHRSFESSPNNLFKPYRINSIQQKDIGRWTISAIEYDPKNYVNANPDGPTFPDSNL